MAKALVFHPANPRVPSEILSILKSYLTKTLAGRMMMTCFLGIFDPRTGSLTASNAGHNDPCLVQGEKVEEVKIRNIPLGIMHRRPYQDHSLVLSGDQVLVFFTDGLIEALDEKGKMIGYERFSQHLPGLIGPDAAGTEKRIREWFREIAEDGPLADDITIMVLQKHRSSQISPEFLKGGPPSMKPQLPVEA
jgi:sigma-B regulation protein RsbU (phosphoserine phosphatase)